MRKGIDLEAHQQDRFLQADQKTHTQQVGIITSSGGCDLSNDQIKTVTTNGTLSNNNKSSEPIRFISGGSLGTFDTVKITSKGVRENDLLDLDGWSFKAGTKFKDYDGGIPAMKKILFLNEEGREVDNENRRSTLGIEFIPFGYGKSSSDLTIINIPSAPALMGNACQPLTPDQIPDFINRVQSIVGNHIKCDVNTFEVSRLDSSTIYSVSDPVPAYISMFNAISSAKKGHSNKKYFQDETVQFFNKSQAVGFYDKGVKEKENGLLIPSDEGSNLLRFELQTKNRQSVLSKYGGIVFSDLQKEGIIIKGLEARSKSFDTYFQLNSKSEKDIKAYRGYMNSYHLFDLLKESGKRNHIANFLRALAIREGLITIDILDTFMRLGGYTPQYINRHNKLLKEIISNWTDPKDLYGEVYELIQNDRNALKAVA